MIKNTDKVHLNGLMVENIEDPGKMENNMEEVYILDLIIKKEKENGTKVKELNGSTPNDCDGFNYEIYSC